MAKQPIESGTTKSTLTAAQVAAQAKTQSASNAKSVFDAAAAAVKKSPTPANIAAVKNAYRVVASTGTPASIAASSALANLKNINASVEMDKASLDATIKEAQDAAAAAEAAAANASALSQPKFPTAGTLIRYEAGTTAETRTPIFADGKGGEYRGPEDVNPLVPGSTGTTKDSERTLAKDTFANTLALTFGKQEATQPWVNEMYNLASGFYNTGSTISEALNLSLYEAKDKGLAPQFTKRFAGVFELQKKLQAGEVVKVPTIADFIQTEADMGATLKEAGLGDLATQEFLGTVIGAGNSVLDVGNLISKVFDRIDNAPKSLKDTLSKYFPGADRTAVAKALLTGTEGAAALEKKVNAVSVLSAAGSQGLNMDLAQAGELALGGATYGSAMTDFGQVKELQRANTIAQFGGEAYTQENAIAATFGGNQEQIDRANALKIKEANRFRGQAGTAASALRGRNAQGLL